MLVLVSVIIFLLARAVSLQVCFVIILTAAE